MPGTLRLHRFMQANPDRVYRAFLDPDAKAKWLPPHLGRHESLTLLAQLVEPEIPDP